VEGRVDAFEKRDNLDIMGGTDDEVRGRCQFPQRGFARRNPFNRVCATEQLVQKDQMRPVRVARANDVDDPLDLVR